VSTVPSNKESTTVSLSVPRVILIVLGFLLAIATIVLPAGIGALRFHVGDGVVAAFGPGPASIKEAIDAVASSVSIVSSVGIAAIAISFEKARATQVSLILGALSLCIYSYEIIFALYLSVLRPLTGIEPTISDIGLLLGLIPGGLALTMFSLAAATE